MIKKPASAPRRGAKFMIEEWMVRDYGLHGTELLLYALIHSFSRDGEGVFNGSLAYIAHWTGCSKPTNLKFLKKLLQKKLIQKQKIHHTSLNSDRYYCEYWTLRSRIET